MSVLRSVPKPQRRSAGAPTPKDPDLVLVKTMDILAWPAVDAGGVNQLGNYVMKPGTTMYKMYSTPSKSGAGFEPEGDEDAVGLTQKVDASHPGNSVEIREFIMAGLGEDFIIFQGTCRDENKTVYGTKCSPMKMKPTFADNADGTTNTFVFEQYMRTDQVPYNYTGTLSFDEPFENPDASIGMATRLAFQLPSTAVTEPLLFDLINPELDGKIVTIIGGGGDDPIVLSNGLNTGEAAPTVILKGGSDWIALQNASITLEIFVGAENEYYLIERSRS